MAGMLAFGPDACLYAGGGDGGGRGDPNNHGQNPFSLLGKLVRLDPTTEAPCSKVISNPFLPSVGAPEVWSLGLRNPWCFSFDRQTGDLYIGDARESAREEIDVAVAPHAGRQANYGWRLMEGLLPVRITLISTKNVRSREGMCTEALPYRRCKEPISMQISAWDL